MIRHREVDAFRLKVRLDRGIGRAGFERERRCVTHAGDLGCIGSTNLDLGEDSLLDLIRACLLYTSPSPRD